MHNLHSCSPELKALIDTHAATLAGWVPAADMEQAREAAVIVASLTEDAVLAAALMARAATPLTSKGARNQAALQRR